MGEPGTKRIALKTGPEDTSPDLAGLSGKRYDDKVPSPHASAADRRLLGITRRIHPLSGSRGHVLQRRRTDIQNLLASADQGILFFGRDLAVSGSTDCQKIFGRRIAGSSIVGLLTQDGSLAKEPLTEIFRCAFDAARTEGREILRQLPAVFRIADKDVRVECKFAPPDGAGGEPQIAMILSDITQVLQAVARMHYLNNFDKLTSLYNRAYIEMTLPELEKKEHLPLSMIMLDMNGLKLVNDVFGHEQGDRLLAALADALKRACRKSDIIGRWGGDEFLVLLPKTSANVCAKVCASIRRAMSDVASNPIPLSAAMGMATKDSGRASLAELFLVAENRMYNSKLIESPDVRRSIVASMEAMLREHCFENAGHSERVARLAAGFAAHLGGLGEMELKLLNKLATLHDIGKVAIPRQILGKPGPLSARELEIAMSHSDIGYRLAQSIGEPILAELILALHERWDGKGYPFGLKGENIPLLVRIFSLVDVFDVVMNDRPYRRAMDKDSTLKEIAAGGGSKFDPELTRRFVAYINSEGGY